MGDWLFDAVFGWLAERLLDALGWLSGMLTTTFFTSPDLTVFPQVQALADRCAMVVSAGYGLAVVAAGGLAMTHGGFQIRYQLKDLFPRLVFGFLASAYATQLCSGVIAVANAVTVALVAAPASGPRVVEFVADRLAHSTWDLLSWPLLVIIALIIVVMLFQLLFTWFTRIAVLLVLAGTAPLAMACYALPQTQPVADLWWRTLAGVLLTPLLQAVVLTTGIDLLLDPDHNLPLTAGLPAGSDVTNLFLIACLLMVTVRVPKFVARFLTTPGASTSTTAVVVRAVLLQTLTRRLPIPGLRRLTR